MRHGEHAACHTQLGCGGEQLIQKWDERGQAFQREAFRAEVPLLDHLLEYIGADQAAKYSLGIFKTIVPLELRLNPRTLLR